MLCMCAHVVHATSFATGQVVRTVQGDGQRLYCLAMAPDGRTVALSSQSLQVRLVDWRGGEEIRSFKAHDVPVLSMAYERTSTLLATGASDGGVRVWDVLNGFCTHNFRGGAGVVSTVRFHPSRPELFSCSADCRVRWWSLEKKRQLASLEAHNAVVTGLAFTGDGRTLFTAGRDQIIMAWDLPTKKPVATLPVREEVEALVLLPGVGGAEQHRLVTAGPSGWLRAWAYPSGKRVGEVQCPAALTGAFLDPASGHLVATTYEHAILLHDPATLVRSRQIVGSYDEVIDVKFVGAAASHVAVATNTRDIQLVNVGTSDATVLQGHTAVVLSLDVSADGLTMVSGAKDNTVRLWRADADHVWHCVGQGVGHNGDVGAVALARGGEEPLAASGSRDNTLKLWRVPAAAGVVGRGGEPEALRAVYTRRAHEKDINMLEFAPNGRLVVSAGQDRLAKVWRTKDGEVVGTLKGHRRGVWAARFSPVDQVVATASGDGTIKIWALADFSCVKTLEGHEGSVHTVQFLSRGRQLLSAGSEGVMKLWTIRTGEAVRTIEAHDTTVWGVAVSPEEDRVVSGGGDGAIVVWRDCTAEDVAVQRAEEDRVAVLSQDLSNMFAQAKYAPAARLAIELERPHQLLKIARAILGSGGQAALGDVLGVLEPAQLGKVLRYCKDWNTNARTAGPAQAMIRAVLDRFRPEALVELPGIRAVVASLIAYSERHATRAKAMHQQSRLLDFAWHSMRPVDAPDGAAAVRQGEGDAGDADETRGAGLPLAEGGDTAEADKRRAEEERDRAEPGAKRGAEPLPEEEEEGGEVAGEKGRARRKRGKDAPTTEPSAGRRTRAAAAKPSEPEELSKPKARARSKRGAAEPETPRRSARAHKARTLE